jgi:hypothetical protein
MAVLCAVGGGALIVEAAMCGSKGTAARPKTATMENWFDTNATYLVASTRNLEASAMLYM